MGEERQATVSLEHKNRRGFDHMVLITRLGIMVNLVLNEALAGLHLYP